MLGGEVSTSAASLKKNLHEPEQTSDGMIILLVLLAALGTNAFRAVLRKANRANRQHSLADMDRPAPEDKTTY